MPPLRVVVPRRPGGLPCYAHVTTATDTNNVKFVFNAIVSIVLEENIR